MRVLTILLALVMMAAGIAAGQKPVQDSSAAANWVLYRDSPAGVAVMMPKVPVRVDAEDICNEKRSSAFYAYAGETVYEFRFYVRTVGSPLRCLSTSKFGQMTLDTRLTELRAANPPPTAEHADLIGGRQGTLFKTEQAGSITQRWVIPDLANKRWVEMAIIYRPDVQPDTKQFFDSLKFSAKAGTDFLTGSSTTLGDPPINDTTTAADTKPSFPFMVIAKPKPGYTDIARQHRVQGTVRVRATFLPSGSVGSVTVVDALPDGLTEQAIYAARRIIFLPPRVNGVRVAATKTIEFSFSVF